VLDQHAGHLEQRRVARGVVADADVPGVEVPVQQHEALGLDRALDLGDDHGDLPPARVMSRDERGLGAAVDLLEQPLPVRARDRRDGQRRLVLPGGQVGRTPDRRADALVDAVARRDRHDADRAARLEVVDPAGHREALGDHDLAADVALALGGGEDVVDRRRVRRVLIDDRRGDPAFRRGHGHARRLRVIGDVAHGQRGAARQADEQLRRVHRVLDAPLRQPSGDPLDRLALLLGPGLPDQRRELLDQRPRFIGADALDDLSLAGHRCRSGDHL
jgi:hypothetical protein